MWRLALVLLLIVEQSLSGEVSFWVWQRSQLLTDHEVTALKSGGVAQLYWHAGTMVLKAGHWSTREHVEVDWKALLQQAKAVGIQVIPTLRLEPAPGEAFTSASNAELETILDALAATSRTAELQIDYESTDRQISAYEAFLAELKSKRKYGLSITALGHWSRFANDFTGLTDEIVPMFYDLNPNRERLNAGETSLPQLVGPSLQDQMASWKGCSLPWKAGLPNFSRVTLLGSDGVSKGNLRYWQWDELWFSPLLTPSGGSFDGQTEFRVTQSGVIADTPMSRGQILVVRYPGQPVLNGCAEAAIRSGARAVVYFKMADDSDMSGWAVEDLAAKEIATPEASLKWDGNRLELVVSGASLMPMVTQGPEPKRLYALVVETDGEGFREAVAGDFDKVTTDADGEHEAGDLGLGVKRLYLWFSHAGPGHALETGLVQRDSSGVIRWSVLNTDKEARWNTLK